MPCQTIIAANPSSDRFEGVGNGWIIPTRCSYLRLKRICLVNMIPAILIILTIHIIIAIRWTLIKILSAVINHHGRVMQLFRVVVTLTITLYAKLT